MNEQGETRVKQAAWDEHGLQSGIGTISLHVGPSEPPFILQVHYSELAICENLLDSGDEDQGRGLPPRLFRLLSTISSFVACVLYNITRIQARQ